MRLQRESSGEQVTISAADLLGSGGEARILSVVSHPSLVAKLYHRPGAMQAPKLAAMLANPPDDPLSEQSHISIAWPLDRLTTGGSEPRFVGYIMPRVIGALPIFQYYNPASRRRNTPLFTYHYLLRAARNLAAAVRALHARGYVVGDINESNILVTPTALVTLVDTNSFQVPALDSNKVYRCTVGKPEYTPPELQGVSFADIDRSPEHDLFGLAIVLFQLLMEGTHPFAGAYLSQGDPPPYSDRITSGHFPYGIHKTPYQPSPSSPPIELLHPTVRSLMLRCFEDGQLNPGARPDAQTWFTALREAELELQICDVNSRHFYGRHLSYCPWCERKLMLAGRDPFPTHSEAQRAAISSAVIKSSGFIASQNSVSSVQSVISQPTLNITSSNRPQASAQPAAQSISIPTPNAWSWRAFVLMLVAVIAYQLGAPGISLSATPAFVFCAIASTQNRLRLRGAWLAAICLPASILTSFDSIIDIRDLRHPPPVRVVSLVSGIRSLTFSPNGKLIVTGTNRAEDQRLIGGEVQEWTVPSGQLVQTLAKYAGSVASVSFAPDSKSIAVASYGPMGAARVEMIDSHFVEVRTTIETTAPGQPSEALSSDGRIIAVGSLNGSVDLIEIDTRQVTRRIRVKGEVLALAFSPDGKSIAVATGSPPGSIVSGAIYVFDDASGKAQWSALCHSNAVLAVAFSPDGKMLASGGNDSWLRIWNAATGKILQQHEVPTIRISTLSYSPTGGQIATGTEPNATTSLSYDVLVYDVANWKLAHTVTGHQGRVTCVAFSPDGKTLASGGLDGTLRLWRLSVR